MKNILILGLILLTHNLWAVCTSPISRTNNTTGQVLTSTKYNLDVNTVYAKVNNLPGDCITDSTVTTSKIADEAITAAKIAADVLAKFIPAGAIMPYGGTFAPGGFLLCNGQAVSRTTYADLYGVIGNSFGAGNGSTTFNVPDFRGRFLRGVDGGTGRDPDRVARTAMASGGNAGDLVGSIQGDVFQSHAHISGLYVLDSRFDVWSTVGVSAGTSYGGTGASSTSAVTSYPITDSASGGSGGTPRYGTETRPINANINYIIKY